jgi:hypothetical protein
MDTIRNDLSTTLKDKLENKKLSGIIQVDKRSIPVDINATRKLLFLMKIYQRNQYHVTILPSNKTKIVDVHRATQGAYQIVNNGQIGNQYNAQVQQVATNISHGGTRHKKKRFRSKTRRIKPSSNVKRR